MAYLFYGAHKHSDMQRNVCLHMGMLFPLMTSLRALLLSLTLKKKEVKEQMFTLHRECCRGRWLTLALALFMIWPSVTLRNPNSLKHSLEGSALNQP